jgi:saccharopine dehydrogenase-like NADP-dependent oxidoreductase
VVQLGCGITGLVCAEQLTKNTRVDEVVLADARTDAAEAMAARVKSDKISLKNVDGTKVANLKKLLKGADLVISSLPWQLNKRVLETAASMGIDYVDFCLTLDRIEEYEPMVKMVKDAGITALTSAGEDPGISDSFARVGANLLDEAWGPRLTSWKRQPFPQPCTETGRQPSSRHCTRESSTISLSLWVDSPSTRRTMRRPISCLSSSRV